MLFLVLLAPLLQLTAAAPATDVAVVGRTHLLGKRGDGTGVHLVNCDAFGGEGTIRPPSSYVVVRLQPRSSSSFCGFPNNHIALIVLPGRWQLQPCAHPRQQLHHVKQLPLHLGGSSSGLHVPYRCSFCLVHRLQRTVAS